MKRRADVVGIFPSQQSIIRLIGAVLLEGNDEWQLQHRYMGVEAMGEILSAPPTNETLQFPPKGRLSRGRHKPNSNLYHLDKRDSTGGVVNPTGGGTRTPIRAAFVPD